MKNRYGIPADISDSERLAFFVLMWGEHASICRRLDSTYSREFSIEDAIIKAALLRKFCSHLAYDQCSIKRTANSLLSTPPRGITANHLGEVSLIESSFDKYGMMLGLAARMTSSPLSSSTLVTDLSIHHLVESVVYSSGVHGRMDRWQERSALNDVEGSLIAWIRAVQRQGDRLASIISQYST